MAARVPVDRASPADLMQLATDVGPAPMHVGAVLILGTGSGFNVAEAQRLLGEGSAPCPGSGSGCAGRAGLRRPFWADDRRLTCGTTSGNCPARHLATAGPAGGGRGRDRRALPRSRPLWSPRSSPAWPTAAPGWSSS